MWTKIKLWGCIIAVFMILVGIMWYQHNNINNLKRQVEYSNNNIYAYEQENAALNGKNIEFLYTIDQLNASNDSLMQKINGIRKDLDIKDKKIKELQYIASHNTKTEYITLRDSIFLEGAVVDTTIGDRWSNLSIHAEAPNLLNVSYSFENEVVIVAHESKITVKPPKKCKIGRWLQKKQTIVEIEVHQENPYCTNKEARFVKIIK